jgi:SNF2 family DNA or RNA helicase
MQKLICNISIRVRAVCCMAYSATPHGTKLALDDEGFVKVKFVTTTKPKIKVKEKISPKISEEESVTEIPSEPDSVPEPSISECLPKGTLDNITEAAIKEMDYTDMLRLAYVSPKAQAIVTKLYGLNGIPMRWGYSDKGELLAAPYKINPHQIQALRWMREAEKRGDYGMKGGILGMKMGLGKSLTTEVHILSTPPEGPWFPSLIVASKTVMYEWKNKGIEKFFGNNIKVMYLHTDFMGKDVKTVTRSDIMEHDLVITTYDAVLSAARSTKYHEEGYEMGDDHSLMKGKIVTVNLRTREQADKPRVYGLGVIFCTPWERVVCDESQTFANPETATYRAVMGIYGRYKWCLTGTPIKNYATDIFTQLRFCGYTGVKRTIEWKRMGLHYMNLHKLRDYIFSMDYQDAKIVLPPKADHTTYITLNDKEKAAYAFIRGKTKALYDKLMKKTCSFASVLAMFTRMRQCAISPYLITSISKREKLSAAKSKADKEALALIKEMSDDSLGKWCYDKKQAGRSTKIMETISILSKIPKNEKVLVFSMFTSCLDLLGDTIKDIMPDYHFLQIDGDVVGTERESILNQFSRDKTVQALFLTYKVGGQGLNLTVAAHCIPIEPWWTDAVDQQAVTRCWRFGQTEKVHVHRVIVKGTIEERVVNITKGKSAMAREYLEGTTKSLEKGVGLSKEMLRKLLED